MQAAPPTISRIANYNNAWTFTVQIKHTGAPILSFAMSKNPFLELDKNMIYEPFCHKFDDKFVNLNERWMIHEIFCHKSVKFELTYGSCPKKKWKHSRTNTDPPVNFLGEKSA